MKEVFLTFAHMADVNQTLRAIVARAYSGEAITDVVLSHGEAVWMAIHPKYTPALNNNQLKTLDLIYNLLHVMID